MDSLRTKLMHLPDENHRPPRPMAPSPRSGTSALLNPFFATRIDISGAGQPLFPIFNFPSFLARRSFFHHRLPPILSRCTSSWLMMRRSHRWKPRELRWLVAVKTACWPTSTSAFVKRSSDTASRPRSRPKHLFRSAPTLSRCLLECRH